MATPRAPHEHGRIRRPSPLSECGSAVTLTEKLSLVSQKSRLAEAIRYALSRWAGLCLFLADGRVELDTNVVERSMRPLALTRKNALFAGSDNRASKYGRSSLPGRMGSHRSVPSCAVRASRSGVASRMA